MLFFFCIECIPVQQLQHVSKSQLKPPHPGGKVDPAALVLRSEAMSPAVFTVCCVCCGEILWMPRIFLLSAMASQRICPHFTYTLVDPFFLGCTGNNRYLSIPCPIIFGDDKPHTSWYWLTHSCFEVIQGPVPYSIKAKAAPPHVDSLPLDLHSSKSMAVGVLTEDGPVSRVHRVPHIQRPSWRQRPHAETARNAAGLKLQKHFY